MFKKYSNDNRDALPNAILIGVLAGLGFALGFWGIGAFSSLGAHGLFPFAKFLVGGLACILVGLLAALLTWRLSPVLLHVVLWALVGVAFNRLSLFVTFPWMEHILGWLDPATQALASYPLEYGVTTRGTLLLVIMVVAGILAGFLSSGFIDEAATSSGFRRWMSLLVWMAAFMGVGMLGDSLNQKPMRQAVQVVDDAIKYANAHTDEELTPEVRLRMGLNGLRPIEDLLEQPYRLIPAGYDQMMVFIKVLVRFDEDTYAMCSVLNNSMGTCKRVTGP